MQNFAPISALIGGFMIGLSAIILMVAIGRIAGISGIVAGLLPPVAADRAWRFAFLLGLVAAPLAYSLIAGRSPETSIPPSMLSMIVGGFLVGFGTRLGSGCTSGHGVCGIARLSWRSLTATAVFMAAGLITVYLVKHGFGG